MSKSLTVFTVLVMFWIAGGVVSAEPAAEVRLVERKPDPHGTPRPARDAREVPLGTSLYVELDLPAEVKGDRVLPESVSIRLEAKGGPTVDVLGPGRKFAAGCSGWILPRDVPVGIDLEKRARQVCVYAEPGKLRPETVYTVRVEARSAKGGRVPKAKGTWRFTTAPAPGVRTLTFPLDLGAKPIRWHGRFFSGLCNVLFAEPSATFGPTDELMNAARRQHPRAWSYQRDFWLTGTEDQKPALFGSTLPNLVRERETRRIKTIEGRKDGTLLAVEDFFGHEQYGIPGGRPLTTDYHPGDEVLVADGVHDARAKVLAVDDKAGTVLVSSIAAPEGGWKIDYQAPLPTREDPDRPGLFPPGGCYLRKFRPSGTPCYYWARLDKTWDQEHRYCGRRLLPNFTDVPGDLALDGRNWTTAKDYAQWHEVARTIAGHVIDRYGPDAMDFTWSIFNEPDLGVAFWRTDWDELQRYYDYTSDAILRAFEDRGYDSRRVFIGGLELGGIFGIHLKLDEFLAHCSPRATAKGALPLNAAVADPRLAGRRSRRVETLCREHGGKGSPCDFISIHAYNRAENMAAKLIHAKEVALRIDPEYYAGLWVNSHESCPDWAPPPDDAAAESYLGNGYFPGWCIDVASRQLHQAARDPRYGYGETILTVWPPAGNFQGINAVTRILHGDDGRQVTLPSPIFHVLGLLSDLGDCYWVLPEERTAGRVVSGFASRDDRGVVRVVLYAHDAADTQSRSETAYDVTLALAGAGWSGSAEVEEYAFDRAHNSYLELARAFRARERETSEVGKDILSQWLGGRQARYSAAEIDEVRRASEVRATHSATVAQQADGRWNVTSHLLGNGVNMLVIRPTTPSAPKLPRLSILE